MKKNENKGLGANVINFLLKWSNVFIAAAAFVYIFYIISSIPSNQISIWYNSIEISTTSIFLIILTIALSYINWLLESEKWRSLVIHIQPISINLAYKSILFGLTLAMITPKRIGEFAGRVFVLNKDNRIKGLLLNALASISQLSITLIFGITSLVFAMLYLQYDNVFINEWNVMIISIALIVLFVISLIIIFFETISKKLTSRIKSQKWQSYLAAFSLVKRKTIFKLYYLSLMRYLVFIFQFYILLHIWGYKIELLPVLLLNSIIYLIMIIIPVSALSESGVKSSVTLLIFGAFPILSGNYNEAALISASLSIWIVNLVLPALLGAFISFYEDFSLKDKLKNEVIDRC
ncbi:MAG: flippase-like domain-containing protein [Bacteroidetes bacterium]|nr:flippase-like domain-containing protein [Bacteroidota bacterium]